MKKIKSTLCAFATVLLLSVLICAVSGLVWAADYTSGDWKYSVSSNTATVTGYTGTATNITIPSSLGGYTVKAIGSQVFKGNTVITKLTVPSGVTTIGGQAFQDCTYLASVSLPSTITSIGTGDYSSYCQSFKGCIRLSTVTIASGGTSEAVIWNSSFNGCTALTSITIPSNYKTIGTDAFYGCTGLKTATITKNIDIYFKRTIDQRAFYGCTELTSITIPEGFTTIGGEAFRSCTYLTTVSLPSTITSIGTGDYSSYCQSFRDCIRLSTVTIASGGTNGAVIWNSSFNGCTALTSIIIPSNYKTIGPDAFYGCTGIKSATITKNADEYFNRTIDVRAFYGCTALTSVTIPEGFTTIGGEAFRNCTYLTTVSLPSTIISIGTGDYSSYCQSFRDCIRLSTVTIASGGTNGAVIWNSSFNGCTALTSITIPSNYKTISKQAFYGCTSLTSVTIHEGLTTIEGEAFSNCTYLTTVSLPSTITSIGTGDYSSYCQSFKDCIRLSTVTFASGGTNEAVIWNSSFNGCTALTSITIPSNYKTISSSAFQNCTALKTAIIEKNADEYFTRSIGSYAFSGCSALTTMHIPSGVTSIGEKAYQNCSANLVICSDSASSYAKTYANANGITFRVCTGHDTTVSVTGVTLSPSTLSMTINQTSQLTATVSPSNATNKSVTWSTSNNNVATVSASGLVTAKAPGTATITVITADGGKTATCVVTVTSGAVSVTGITLSPSTLSMTINQTSQLTATVSPSNATNKSVMWSTSNNNVASVANGLVTAKAPGTATITVITADGGKTATCVVTVTDVTLSSISIRTLPSKLSYHVGETLDTTGLTLTATFSDNTWLVISSANITCTPITLTTAGTQQIAASYGGMTVYFNVTVAHVTLSYIEISSNPSKISYFLGDTLNTTGLMIKLHYSDKSTTVVNSGFACSPTVLTNTGVQKIIVTYLGKTTSFNVYVSEAGNSGFVICEDNDNTPINDTGITFNYKDETRLIAYFYNESNGLTVTWTSDSPKVVSVNENGKIKMIGRGTAIITATIAGTDITAKFTVSVKYTWWQWLIAILLFGWIWY